MGRKSKLSVAQWAEIGRRLMDGESQRSLAAQFGISGTALRLHLAALEKTPTVQKVANMLVETEAALKSLPISAQITAHSLAAKLRSISDSLASAADLGAKTAHRLNALANSEVGKIDDAKPMASIENLRNVGVLTKLANDSASIGVSLLAANRETIQRLNAPEVDDAPKAPLRPQLTREQWLAQHGIG